MRGGSFLVVLLVSAFAATAVSGCFGNSIVIAGQGGDVGSSSKSKSLTCPDGHGTVTMGVQGGGSISVKVTDGDGVQIFKESFNGGGQEGQAQKLRGIPGTWTMTVSTGAAFGGQYSVTLSC